jgi:phosphoribosylglycinamide formyltransferase 1
LARAIVLASGNGSNFEAITRRVSNTHHQITALVYDRKNAKAAVRAKRLCIPAIYISYYNRSREEAEADIASVIDKTNSDLIIFAGFMRLLSSDFVEKYYSRIINIHPSLLPKHPGLNAIKHSFESDDKNLGITIHLVDSGLDSGPIINQFSFPKNEVNNIIQAEERIHQLEHHHYPEIIIKILDEIDSLKGG